MTDILNSLHALRSQVDFPLSDEEEERLIGEAVLDALREHKKAGNPVAIWEDGKVKIVQPEDIILPEDTVQ